MTQEEWIGWKPEALARDNRFPSLTRRASRGRSALAIGLILALSAGCGSDNGYRSISGSVSFEGNSVNDGVIQFYTQGEQPAPVGGTTIKNGRYVVPAAHGLKPGAYTVRISSRERIEVKDNPFASRELIPEKYNEKSVLSIDVKEGGTSTFDFRLE